MSWGWFKNWWGGALQIATGLIGDLAPMAVIDGAITSVTAYLIGSVRPMVVIDGEATATSGMLGDVFTVYLEGDIP